jgi:heat shock protein 1/8
MVNEAKMYEKQDEEHRARIEAKNSLGSYAYSLKQTLNDPVAGGLQPL